MKKSICFASKFENVDLAEKFVNTIFEYEEVNEIHFGNIIIAVTESVNNAIEHGNSKNPEKEVALHYFKEDNKLGFVISDQGNGFDFENLPDPTLAENLEKETGRGIFLMKNLADDVVFSDSGRSVEMTFLV